jgi:hypothetical protein
LAGGHGQGGGAGGSDSGSGAGGRSPDADAAESASDGGVASQDGDYLVALATPTRTYLDSVHLLAGTTWRVDVNGMPAMAQWENEADVTAVRIQLFSPGDVLTPAQILALLPITAPASRSLDVTAAPYRAAPSPADATAAIQSALTDASTMADAAHPVDVVIPSGTFDYDAVLEVGANVRLRGSGGTLHATDATVSAVHLGGDRSGALFLTITSPATSRATTPDSGGIWVGPRTASGAVVHDTLVVGNEIDGVAGAHVFAIQENGGLWAFNYAHDGYADTFHHTGQSSYCQVVGNRAQTAATRGDDLYAFVGYAGDGDPVHHCTCIANWGRDGAARGLSAVGGGFISFSGNDIARTQWAGIYVARESSYQTYGSFDVSVFGNHVADANLGGSHDGFLAYADDATESASSKTFGSVSNMIRNLVVNGNAFTDTSAGVGNGFGIEVRSSVDTGQVIDNTVTHAKAPGIVVAGTGFTVSSNTFTP